MIEETLEMQETPKNCKCSREQQVFKRHEKSSLGLGFLTCEASDTRLETLWKERLLALRTMFAVRQFPSVEIFNCVS